MKEKKFGEISVKTDTPFLFRKIDNYSDIGTYTQQNVNMVNIQLINMLSETEIVNSVADYQTSGTITAKSESPLMAKKPRILSDQLPSNDGIEFIYMLNGSATEIINQTSYEMKTHEAILMSPNCRKVMHPHPKSNIVIITIAKQFIELHRIPNYFHPFFFQMKDTDEYTDSQYICFQCKELPEKSYEEVDAVIHQLYHEIRKRNPGFDDITCGLIKRLFAYVASTELYSQQRISNRVIKPQELAEQIRQYLDTHPRKVTINELSKEFHYHRDYISKLFLKETNQTIKQYNTAVYQKEAFRLLTQTDLSITEIAKSIGFSSRSQFYNSFFAHYHFMPNDLRQK